MNKEIQLAARLRQSVQGCTIHLHGPVQAWWEIIQSSKDGNISKAEVSKIAVLASTKRIDDLIAQGAENDDPRIQKEELTRKFITALLH